MCYRARYKAQCFYLCVLVHTHTRALSVRVHYSWGSFQCSPSAGQTLGSDDNGADDVDDNDNEAHRRKERRSRWAVAAV